MHPDLEDFLAGAFEAVQPTVNTVGHVLVEPDYNVAPDQQEADRLARELVDCLHKETLPVDFPEAGVTVTVDPEKYALLKKYVLRISLHRDPIPGAWVEVAPPGNWI
jgi:hypothetical protein